MNFSRSFGSHSRYFIYFNVSWFEKEQHGVLTVDLIGSKSISIDLEPSYDEGVMQIIIRYHCIVSFWIKLQGSCTWQTVHQTVNLQEDQAVLCLRQGHQVQVDPVHLLLPELHVYCMDICSWKPCNQYCDDNSKEECPKMLAF